MTTITPATSPRVGPSKTRVEAFSDGVFAVAITLLVLEVALEHPAEPGHLRTDLGGLGYHYAAYAISFLTIGIMWVSHHNLFSMLTDVDHGTLYGNLLLLGVVSFIPFPTGILAEYVQGEGDANRSAAIGLYGVTLVVLSAAFTLMWTLAYRRPHSWAPGVTHPEISKNLVRSAAAIVVYALATALSPFIPLVTLAAFAVIVVVFALAKPPTSS